MDEGKERWVKANERRKSRWRLCWRMLIRNTYIGVEETACEFKASLVYVVRYYQKRQERVLWHTLDHERHLCSSTYARWNHKLEATPSCVQLRLLHFLFCLLQKDTVNNTEGIFCSFDASHIKKKTYKPLPPEIWLRGIPKLTWACLTNQYYIWILLRQNPK